MRRFTSAYVPMQNNASAVGDLGALSWLTTGDRSINRCADSRRMRAYTRVYARMEYKPGFMRIFYELRYTVIIEIVWTFYLKSKPAKFQKCLKHISWVISGTSSSRLSCNPRHPSRNISCNHRHHLLQPSWRRIFSTSNNQKIMVDSDINSDYKASSFDKLYIRRRKWDTAGFVRAHQRKYWNALTVGRRWTGFLQFLLQSLQNQILHGRGISRWNI